MRFGPWLPFGRSLGLVTLSDPRGGFSDGSHVAVEVGAPHELVATAYHVQAAERDRICLSPTVLRRTSALSPGEAVAWAGTCRRADGRRSTIIVCTCAAGVTVLASGGGDDVRLLAAVPLPFPDAALESVAAAHGCVVTLAWRRSTPTCADLLIQTVDVSAPSLGFCDALPSVGSRLMRLTTPDGRVPPSPVTLWHADSQGGLVWSTPALGQVFTSTPSGDVMETRIRCTVKDVTACVGVHALSLAGEDDVILAAASTVFLSSPSALLASWDGDDVIGAICPGPSVGRRSSVFVFTKAGATLLAIPALTPLTHISGVACASQLPSSPLWLLGRQCGHFPRPSLTQHVCVLAFPCAHTGWPATITLPPCPDSEQPSTRKRPRSEEASISMQVLHVAVEDEVEAKGTAAPPPSPVLQSLLSAMGTRIQSAHATQAHLAEQLDVLLARVAFTSSLCTDLALRCSPAPTHHIPQAGPCPPGPPLLLLAGAVSSSAPSLLPPLLPTAFALRKQLWFEAHGLLLLTLENTSGSPCTLSGVCYELVEPTSPSSSATVTLHTPAGDGAVAPSASCSVTIALTCLSPATLRWSEGVGGEMRRRMCPLQCEAIVPSVMTKTTAPLILASLPVIASVMLTPGCSSSHCGKHTPRWLARQLLATVAAPASMISLDEEEKDMVLLCAQGLCVCVTAVVECPPLCRWSLRFLCPAGNAPSVAHIQRGVMRAIAKLGFCMCPG